MFYTITVCLMQLPVLVIGNLQLFLQKAVNFVANCHIFCRKLLALFEACMLICSNFDEENASVLTVQVHVVHLANKEYLVWTDFDTWHLHSRMHHCP